MPLHPEALRRAQEKADSAVGLNAYDRALIQAYLSDEAVQVAAADSVASTRAANDMLQAIGAEGGAE